MQFWPFYDINKISPFFLILDIAISENKVPVPAPAENPIELLKHR
jgi:hypothetical protein